VLSRDEAAEARSTWLSSLSYDALLELERAAARERAARASLPALAKAAAASAKDAKAAAKRAEAQRKRDEVHAKELLFLCYWRCRRPHVRSYTNPPMWLFGRIGSRTPSRFTRY
jgi:hypothetical protein